MKKCINCGADLIDTAKFCMECGVKQEEPKKYCKECGEELVPAAKFCMNCGTPVNHIDNGQNDEPKNENSQSDNSNDIISQIKQKGGFIVYNEEDEDSINGLLDLIEGEAEAEVGTEIDRCSNKVEIALKSDNTTWIKFGEPCKNVFEFGNPDDTYERDIEFTIVDKEILLLKGEGDTFKILSEKEEKECKSNYWNLNNEISAFKNKIREVVFLSSDTYINERLFRDFINLEIVFVDDDVKGFRDEAFYNCPLKFINMPNALEKIGTHAFKGAKFQIIFFPPLKSVPARWNISYGAFADCKDLKYVFIPKSLFNEIIDFGSCFKNCDQLDTNIIWNFDEIKPSLQKNKDKDVQSTSSDENSGLSNNVLNAEINLEYKKGDNGKYGFVDDNDQWVIQPQYDDADEFSEGFAKVKINDKYGFIKTDGSWLVEPQYDYALDFRNGFAKVEVDNMYGFIKSDGSWLVEPKFDEAWNFYDGIARVMIDEEYGFIKTDGTYLKEPQYEDAGDFHEGFAIVVEDDEAGYIKTDGSYLVEPKFRRAWDFKDGIAQVIIEEEYWLYGFLKSDGTYLLEPIYDYVDDFYKGITTVKKNDKYGFFKKDGTWLVKLKFDDADNFRGEYTKVKVGDKYGFIKMDGSWLIEPKFEDAGAFREGLARIKVGDKWGYIKEDGSYLVEPKFDDAEDFSDEEAWVVLNGKEGYVDTDGNFR